MQEWLLWTDVITFGLLGVMSLFRSYFLLVLATLVIGLGTYIWVRFIYFPPIVEAYNRVCGGPASSAGEVQAPRDHHPAALDAALQSSNRSKGRRKRADHLRQGHRRRAGQSAAPAAGQASHRRWRHRA